MYKILLLWICIILFPVYVHAQLTAPVSLSGYAWSSNIGWISFDGPGYGVTIETDGDLTGYAWSSNIGWIKFGGLTLEATQIPGGQARVNFTTNELQGWVRACAATVNKDCTGAVSPDAGGWNGWISFNCSNTSSCATNQYKISTLAGSFTNYAWGGDVIGWLKMNTSQGVTFAPPCAGGTACTADGLGKDVTDQWCIVTTVNCPGSRKCDVSNPGAACIAGDIVASLSVTPRKVRVGNTAQVTWTATNVSACDVAQSNPGGIAMQSWSGTSGTNVPTAALTGLTVFRLSCSDVDGLNYREVASTTVDIIPVLIET